MLGFVVTLRRVYVEQTLFYGRNNFHYETALSCIARRIGGTAVETRSSAVAKRPRDASRLSVVSFNIHIAQFSF